MSLALLHRVQRHWLACLLILGVLGLLSVMLVPTLRQWWFTDNALYGRWKRIDDMSYGGVYERYLEFRSDGQFAAASGGTHVFTAGCYTFTAKAHITIWLTSPINGCSPIHVLREQTTTHAFEYHFAQDRLCLTDSMQTICYRQTTDELLPGL